jgi:transcriptional regulator with XRE-family HTH domain
MSSTLNQRELGIRLRQLRDAHGLTVEEVAERLLCSATKISRAETGARKPTLRDVRGLYVIYAADPETSAELMELARQAGGINTTIMRSRRSSPWSKTPPPLQASGCHTFPRCFRPKTTPER